MKISLGITIEHHRTMRKSKAVAAGVAWRLALYGDFPRNERDPVLWDRFTDGLAATDACLPKGGKSGDDAVSQAGFTVRRRGPVVSNLNAS